MLLEMQKEGTTEKINVLQVIERQVKAACQRSSNVYGCNSWTHHILPAVKYAKLLAEKLDADVEVVELAALLHDFASISNPVWDEQHHVYGAALAENLLHEHNYPEEKIFLIRDCIMSHRGSKELPKKSLEARIVASADALAHFDNVDSLLYLVYVKKGMEVDDGAKWVLEKLERDWKKLMPEGRELIADKYEAIKKTLA